MRDSTEIKFPCVYLMIIKRGMFWSKRRVEIYEDSLKYFNPVDDQLRFEADLGDCIVNEEFPDSNNKILIITSKSKKFDNLRIKHEEKHVYDKFKEDLHSITNIYNLKNKERNSLITTSNTKRTLNQMFNEENIINKNVHSKLNSQSDFKNVNDEGDEEISFKKRRTLQINSDSYPTLDINYKTNQNTDSGDKNIGEINCLSRYCLSKIAKKNFNYLKTVNNCLIEFNGNDKNILKLLRDYKNSYRYDLAVIIITAISLLFLFILSVFSLNNLIQKIFYGIIMLSFLILALGNKYLNQKTVSNSISLVKESESTIKVSKIFQSDLDKQFFQHFTDINLFLLWNKSIICHKVEEKNKVYEFCYKNNLKFQIQREIDNSNNECNNIFYRDCQTGKQIMNYIFEANQNKSRVSVLFYVGGMLDRINNGNQFLQLIKETSKNLNFLDEMISHKKFDSEISLNKPSYGIEEKITSQEVLKDSSNQSEIDSNKNISTIESNKVDNQIKLEENIIKLEEPIQNEPVNKYLEIATRMNELLEEFMNKKWEIMEDKKDFKSYYYDEVSGLRSTKAETVINKSMKVIFDHMLNLDKRGEYDKNFETGHKLEVINDNLWIDYLKFKGKLFFAPRDFIILTQTQYNEENGTTILCKSIESDLYKKNNNIERAELIIGGVVLRKIDGIQTSVIVFNLSDLKLKKYLVNQVLKDVMKSVKNLKSILEK